MPSSYRDEFIDSPVHQILCLILGGGRGSRLYPLTKDRSKPAVPFGGNYRIIDIPISNCIHSGINRIFVLTQFNSASLNTHISQTYKFDVFHKGFVEILASEQSFDNYNSGFSEGTADAVRKSLKHIHPYRDVKYSLILAGDQLYRMNFRALMARHIETQADITMGVLPITSEDAPRFGIVKVDEKSMVTGFVEKPKSLDAIQDFKMLKKYRRRDYRGKEYLASMFIYLFSQKVLEELLMEHPNYMDFGKEVMPEALKKYKVAALIHEGYWEDIGTLKSYHTANMELLKRKPSFNLYEEGKLLFTTPRFMPPTKIDVCKLNRALISGGCIIQDRTVIRESIIGVRSLIGVGSKIEQSIILGRDFWETPSEMEANAEKGIPNVEIGKHCEIRNTIIDKNCRIGDNVRILNEKGVQNIEEKNYYIQDGIIVIPKGTVLPDNTVI